MYKSGRLCLIIRGVIQGSLYPETLEIGAVSPDDSPEHRGCSLLVEATNLRCRNTVKSSLDFSCLPCGLYIASWHGFF